MTNLLQGHSVSGLCVFNDSLPFQLAAFACRPGLALRLSQGFSLYLRYSRPYIFCHFGLVVVSCSEKLSVRTQGFVLFSDILTCSSHMFVCSVQ